MYPGTLVFVNPSMWTKVSSSLALVLALLHSPAASAYECTRVSDGSVSQAWLSRCVPFALSVRNDRLLEDSSLERIRRSFDVWQDVACSDFEFMHVGYTTETEFFDVESPETQFNAIAILDSWSEAPIPEARLLALTLTHFVVQTGEILDADIIFNGEDFELTDVNALSACDAGTDRNTYDFENTLVHEIGHFIGFDHTSSRDSTMFAEADACETSKRSLDADDEMGICDVYPSGAAVAACLPPPGGYDGDIDTTPFRDQCVRYTSGERVALSATEARELNPPGGCSCKATGTTAHDRPWLLLAWLLALTSVGRRSAASEARSEAKPNVVKRPASGR